MGRSYIFNQRKISVSNYHLQAKECEKFSLWKNSAENKCASFDRVSFIGLTNSTNVHYNTVSGRRRSDEYCEKTPQLYEQNYENLKLYSLDELPTSIVDTKNDLRSSENIFNEWKDIKCKMINLSKKLRSKIFQDPVLEQVIIFRFKLISYYKNMFLCTGQQHKPVQFSPNHRFCMQT